MTRTRTRTRTLLLVLALSAALLAGCGGEDDAAVEGAAGPQPHNAADVTFAQGMIPHHQQAITMSDLALAEAQRTEVKDLARRIKDAQQPEIDQMKGWLSQWGEEASGDEHAGHGGGSMDMDMGMGMGMLSDDEMSRLRAAEGAEFDRLFLEGMIRHHEGAVDMARTEVAEGQFTEATGLARRIIEDQQAEIAEMRGLLAR